MKKSNIIALITLIVIFAGVCSNGIILRNKFLNGDFDDPYKNGIKEILPPVASICFMNDTAYFSNTGEIRVVHSDTINQFLSTKQDISYEVKNGKLTVVKKGYNSRGKILLTELEKVEVISSQFINIEGFHTKDMCLVAEHKSDISLIDCHIENLIIMANDESRIYIDSSNSIQNLDLKLASKSAFTSRNVAYNEFIYDVQDNCDLIISGRSLDVLK
ncbi:MAG: DUF2807 domain-containing protein [Bacteroidales bacterium]|jgi:hypothetical protein|nr:DUF2807 domain-containing protein [Bacteroidales bacterium]